MIPLISGVCMSSCAHHSIVIVNDGWFYRSNLRMIYIYIIYAIK